MKVWVFELLLFFALSGEGRVGAGEIIFLILVYDVLLVTGFILLQAYKKLSLFMTILAKKIMTFL